MKVEQILIQPIGQRFNAGTLTVKTFKKTWQVGKVWWSQVICMDETGEMPVDVNVGKAYNPIRGRGKEITAIVANVQNAEYLGKDRLKLVVEQYSMPTQTVDEFESRQDEINEEVKLIVRSKIKCWLTSGLSPKIEYDFQTHKFSPPPGLLLDWLVEFTKDERLDKVVDGIIGEES